MAFSGGVDSTILAFMAHAALGNRALAVTAASPTYPAHQLDEAKMLASRLKLNHLVIHTDEFNCDEFLSNPPERCYYCKLELIKELRKLADEQGHGVVLEGSNMDDKYDFRPGHRAIQEMGVKSPLQEVGLTKTEIRHLSKKLRLPTWNKPAYACLASRIPYGQRITLEALRRIDQAEEFLHSLGFSQVRVRDHYPLARIEVTESELKKAWKSRKNISTRLHEIGFPYVTIDLDGFRSGSMNEVLKIQSTVDSQ